MRPVAVAMDPPAVDEAVPSTVSTARRARGGNDSVSDSPLLTPASCRRCEADRTSPVESTRNTLRQEATDAAAAASFFASHLSSDSMTMAALVDGGQATFLLLAEPFGSASVTVSDTLSARRSAVEPDEVGVKIAEPGDDRGTGGVSDAGTDGSGVATSAAVRGDAVGEALSAFARSCAARAAISWRPARDDGATRGRSLGVDGEADGAEEGASPCDASLVSSSLDDTSSLSVSLSLSLSTSSSLSCSSCSASARVPTPLALSRASASAAASSRSRSPRRRRASAASTSMSRSPIVLRCRGVEMTNGAFAVPPALVNVTVGAASPLCAPDEGTVSALPSPRVDAVAPDTLESGVACLALAGSHRLVKGGHSRSAMRSAGPWDSSVDSSAASTALLPRDAVPPRRRSLGGFALHNVWPKTTPRLLGVMRFVSACADTRESVCMMRRKTTRAGGARSRSAATARSGASASTASRNATYASYPMTGSGSVRRYNFSVPATTCASASWYSTTCSPASMCDRSSATASAAALMRKRPCSLAHVVSRKAHRHSRKEGTGGSGPGGCGDGAVEPDREPARDDARFAAPSTPPSPMRMDKGAPKTLGGRRLATRRSVATDRSATREDVRRTSRLPYDDTRTGGGVAEGDDEVASP
mmetsp:Transcript_11349/g.36056  ORF Transcript_11349/g.36056 Transcript_11349/m.36056 type:complete len:647 (+) Transcript_11349:912-2852(+)